mmetsp:Transcript_18568/g.71662  ORF Transcript_18568/g.71662 Transcript_18568/m.71662 type:complete len:230 (-) Transcript_18568:1805-2494(-)
MRTELRHHRLEPMQRIEVHVLVQQLQDVRHANREPIVGEEGDGLLVALALELLLVLCNLHMRDVVQREGRDDDVEILEVDVVLVAELSCEGVHQHLEVVRTLREVLNQVLHRAVQVLGGGDGGGREALVLDEVLELGDVLEVGQELDCVGDVLKATGANEANVSHGVADLRHETAELVEVGHVVGEAQLADVRVELIRAVVGVHAAQLLLVVPKEPHILEQPGLDVFVV